MDWDAAVVGVLTALTVGLGTVHWYLLVKPEVLLWFFRDGDTLDGAWFEEHPATLGALQWATGVAVFLLGVVTGASVAFLAVTGR